MTFDGSPTGGGAILQYGLTDISCRGEFPIAFYWRTTWTEQDANLLDAKIGDCASQAKWEAYTLLLACIKGLPVLTRCNSTVHLVGDALGVLCDALKFRARDPVLNRLLGELALRVAPIGLELEALHCWSEWNQLCDELSRSESEPSCDVRLAKAQKSKDFRPRWVLL